MNSAPLLKVSGINKTFINRVGLFRRKPVQVLKDISFTFSLRSSAVPPPLAVLGFRLLANCSNMVSVLAGSKSNT
mgnify:CR=1 FL=1